MKLLSLLRPPQARGKERVKVSGQFTLRHKKADGTIIQEFTKKNLVVDVGLAEVAGLLNGATSGAFDYLAVGTDNTAVVAGDTALGAEITTGGGARAQDSSPTRDNTGGVTNDTAVLDYEWTFSAPFAVVEAGVLDAASAGVLLCRQVFSAINVVSTDKLEITWKVTIS